MIQIESFSHYFDSYNNCIQENKNKIQPNTDKQGIDLGRENKRYYNPFIYWT